MKFIILFFFLLSATAEEVRYFNRIFGHVHLSPHATSSSLTTISCGFPLRIKQEQKTKHKNWIRVIAGDESGYIFHEYLSDQKPDCFQAKYPHFYNALNLDLSDLYYWGRLLDQVITVEVQP